MTDVKKVAILGGTGFVGMELFRILNFHKGFEVHFISSESKAGKPIINQHLWENKIKYKSINELDGNYDAIFSCLPSGALPKHINNVINKAKVIFNVSGDYRIKEKKVSSEYYPSTDWSALDVNVQYYIPEFHVLDKKSKIINLPGCMAVSSIYAIYPLLKNNLIDNEGIILDIKTGSSGGGKNTAETHAERFNNFRLHKAFKHKHQPEIEKYLNEISSRRNNINFTSYSLDIPRGIYVSAYSRLKDGVTDVDVKKAFFREYKGKEFIKYFSNINSINIKNVLGSNSSHTSFKINNNICLSVSTIDNLVKGAAGQAIQAANIYFEYNEHEGLETPKGVLWP